MGMLIEGIWQDRGYEAHKNAGHFVSAKSAFRAEISSQPGAVFPAQAGHYTFKRHYYTSHRDINSNAIAPVGPTIDFDVPHGRG